MNHSSKNDDVWVVIHFLRSRGGALRCRVVNAVSKATWLMPDAETLYQLIFTSAPEQSAGQLPNRASKIEIDGE